MTTAHHPHKALNYQLIIRLPFFNFNWLRAGREACERAVFLIALTFFVGSALAGAAGVVQGLYFGITVFNIGFQAGLKAFTAAVLGGIGNTTGAALGGFVIGFLEVISSVWGQGRWSEAVVFGVLVLVLVFRPTGILGQQLADRA